MLSSVVSGGYWLMWDLRTWLTIGTSFIFLLWFVGRGLNRVKVVPSPPSASLVWGHQRTVFNESAGRAYRNWFEGLNTTVIRIHAALWKPDILVIVDPQAVAHIMNRKIFDYPHSDVSRPRIERLLGRSLGWVEGESEHKRMHSLAASSFSPEATKKGSRAIYDAAATLCQKLENVLETEASTGLVVDITKWMQQATLDAIGQFAFGHDFFGGESNEAQEILHAWRDMAKVAISDKGFYGLMLLRRFPFIYHLPLEVLRSQGNVRNTIQAGIALDLLKRNEALLASKNDLPEDFLFELLKAHQENLITRQELLDHVAMFTIAGSETTAQGLSYAIWELAKNPEIQNKLRDEVLSFPRLGFDNVQNDMTYLDAVTRETLRFHPPTPYMERVASKPDILPLQVPFHGTDGKIHSEIVVNPGQTIIIPIHTMNRMDSVWGDGHVFRPGRWIDPQTFPQQATRAGGWSNMMTFSDGPRICTGYRFAVVEFKLFLAHLIKNFEFSETGAQIVHRYASTMNPVVIGKESEGPSLPIRVACRGTI